MEQLHPKAKWLFFVKFVLAAPGYFGILFVLSGVLVNVFVKDRGEVPIILTISWIIWLIFLAAFIITAIYFWASWTYKNYGYQLVDNAIKIEKGVIAKKYISIPYDRIQNVDINRGLFDRLLGLSDLQIQTAGYSGFLSSEGRLPGLDPRRAELLREELIQRVQGIKRRGE